MKYLVYALALTPVAVWVYMCAVYILRWPADNGATVLLSQKEVYVLLALSMPIFYGFLLVAAWERWLTTQSAKKTLVLVFWFMLLSFFSPLIWIKLRRSKNTAGDRQS